MRLHLVVRGVVQGVGFRPFVRRSAMARGLSGSVANGRDAVRIEVQGAPDAVASFARSLELELPRAASIHSTEKSLLAERLEDGFHILESDLRSDAAPMLPPDLATCEACWHEVFDPDARRYRYPFTSCAACGPRHSIALSPPYDRERTSMRAFTMCAACQREYDDIDDRRHHAQTLGCPACGPQLTWLAGEDKSSMGAAALVSAVRVLRGGGIVALKGIGGFQLLVDATNVDAVSRLRARKRRPDKPLAVLFTDLAQAREHAVVSVTEAALLATAAAPIVLLDRRPSTIADEVTRGISQIGVMLPTSPLHALLTRDLGRPLVCTSGNASGDPLCITIEQALAQLDTIADGFLTHDRAVARPIDDSVARLSTAGSTVLLRRARGYTPRVVAEAPYAANGLALGAHTKSTVTLVHRGAFIPSQHLGDLHTAASRELARHVALDLCRFFDARPNWIACDAHPEYASTHLAEELAAVWRLPLRRIQHHHAHLAACIAEHAPAGTLGLSAHSVLGLAWDGTGWGDKKTIWGGEALLCEGPTATRVATMRPFPLPGGERAAREPRRAALGLLYACGPSYVDVALEAWPARDHVVLRQALEHEINTPLCSSMGRLFDAVAALVGLHPRTSFEGQAAMALEQLARACSDSDAYPFPLVVEDGLQQLDPRPLVAAILEDRARGVSRERIARRFHGALTSGAVAIAAYAGRREVVLAGGCFQNRLLAEGIEAALRARGHVVLLPRALPANDGAISVGQGWIAALDERLSSSESRMSEETTHATYPGVDVLHGAGLRL